MTDDVERLLTAGAGSLAGRPADRAAIERRAARQRRTRRTAAGGAATLGVALVVALVSAGQGAPHNTGLTVTEDPPATMTTPAPEPARTRTPTTPPPPPATAEPSARPSPATTAPSPSAAVTAPPGGGSRFAVTKYGDDGLRVTLLLDVDADPAAGERVTLRVRASDPDGFPSAGLVDWGDGTDHRRRYGEPVDSPDDPCGWQRSDPDRPEPATNTQSWQHAWRQPGEYTVRLVVTAPPSCVGATPKGAWEEVTLSLPVTVRPGRTTSNGPAPVELAELAVGLRDDGSRTVDLLAVGEDVDGWVRDATIDWGDGTAPVTVPASEPCGDEPRAYPVANWLEVREQHTYDPGDYTVTVTFTSVGCDGRDAQRVTGTRRVTVTVP